MIRGFRQIAVLTFVSRVFGFVRDMAYSHFFGAGTLLDAWTIAFKIPNLARRLFGEGAAAASVIPVYSQALHDDPEQAAQLVNTVLTVLFVILAGIVVVGQIAVWGYYVLFSQTDESRLVLSLTAVTLPYSIFICLVAVLAGVLQVHRHFAAPAAAPLVLNIFIICTIPLTSNFLRLPPRQQVFLVAVAVLAAGLVQLVMQLPPLWRIGVSIRPGWQIHTESFKKIILLMGPMVIGLTATQINTLADDLIAWWLSGSAEKGASFAFLGRQIAYPLARGSVSHLYFAQRLYQLPLGVFGISLATAVFPVMSAFAAQNNLAELSRTVSQALRGIVFVALPASVGLVIVAGPLISVAFQHGRFGSQDTARVTWTLWFYAIGLCGYFSQQILVRAFYSMQDSMVPLRSALVAVCANIVLNLTLVWPLAVGGLALATALCSYLQVLILTLTLRKRLGGAIFEGLPAEAAKTIAATLAMSFAAVAVMYASRGWPGLVRLAVVVLVAAGCFLLAAKLLRTEMLALLRKPQVQ